MYPIAQFLVSLTKKKTKPVSISVFDIVLVNDIEFLGRKTETRPGAIPTLLMLLASSIVGVLVAYLLANGQWNVALLLIVFVPGIIVLHRYPFVTVVLWLFLIPFLLQTPTSAERQLYWLIHRALPPLTVALMLAAVLSGNSRRSLPRLGLPELAMAGYVVLSLFSIYLQNHDRLTTTYQFYDQVFIPMCLYLIIRLSALGEKEMTWLIIAAFFISLSQSIIGTLSWVAPQILPSMWLDKEGSRTVGTLVNTNIYTTTLVFSGLLILHASLNSRPGLVPRVFKITFLLTAYSIFISFSRASWIAGILVVLGLIYLYPKFVVQVILLVGVPVVLLGGGIFADQLRWAGERLDSTESEVSAYSRVPVAYAALHMFQAKPLFGWGYGNFDLYDRQFYEMIPGVASDDKDHASHNLYLTILAEQGIVGLLLFVAPLICWLALTFKKLPRMPKSGLWGRKLLIILVLVVFSHIIVNNFSNMQVVFGLGMWWIVLSLIAGLVDTERLPDPAGGKRAQSLGCFGVQQRLASPVTTAGD